MIHKQLDQISKADIDELVANSTSEIKTLEYKQTVPGNTDNDKKEFLADVSSFANASGGDLVFGVTASAGIATSAPGISVANLDAELLRLESLIRDGVAPRIPGVQFHKVEGFTNGHVLIIRVPKSWASPHMVTLKGTSRFFARNSAGKYQLDVGEIRAAFLLSDSIPERIRNFRVDRLAKIGANEGPMPMPSSPKVVFHLIPLAAMAGESKYDIAELKKHAGLLQPPGGRSSVARVNIDGLFAGGGNDQEVSFYCQCFRDGIIESVDGSLTCQGTEAKLIPSTTFEQELMGAAKSYFQAYRELGIPPPCFALLSLIGFRGYQMGAVTRTLSGYVPPIDRDMVNLPEIVVDDYSVPVNLVLRPLLDMAWNAAGWDGSPNFDAAGEWKPRR